MKVDRYKRWLKYHVFGVEVSRKYTYFRANKRWPNLSNPQWFSEKVLRRIFRTNDPRFTVLADKVKVRDFVNDKVGKEVLIPQLGIYDHIKPEDIQSLNEERVVLKNNHDSGSCVIVNPDKDDLESICTKLNENSKKPFGISSGEYWYQYIEPKIIAEKFIGDEKGTPPSDYRFHMFNQGNGNFEVVFSINYYEDNNRTVTFYDENLTVLPFSVKNRPNNKVPRNKTPEIEKALDVAKTLAADFDYVRVDLYITQGKVYFGELTFSPNGGNAVITPDEYEIWMGNLWK